MMLRSAADEFQEYLAAWQPEIVAHVLDGLDRISKRGQASALVQKRRCERRAYSAIVSIMQNRAVRLRDGSRAKLPLMARNLSRSGLGLLAPLHFEPAASKSRLPPLQSRNIFREGTCLEIGLQKGDGVMLWVYGTVMRARVVQHDFLDLGVRFTAKVDVFKELGLEE
jgi:hypothetical protein